MPLIVTPGAADAQSYVSIARANTLLLERLHTEPWDEAPFPLRERALMQATRLLDTHVAWDGTPASTTQALAWPMTGQADQYGNALSATVIPAVLERATAYYALALLRDVTEIAGSMEMEGLEEFRQGDTHLVFRQTGRTAPANVTLPAEIRQMLRPYGQMAGGITVELLRT